MMPWLHGSLCRSSQKPIGRNWFMGLCWGGLLGSLGTPLLAADAPSLQNQLHSLPRFAPQNRPALKVPPAERTTVVVAATSDLHGWLSTVALFPKKPARGILHIAPVIKRLRREYPDLILLDAGDTLQGSPTNYYFNHVAPTAGPLPIIKLMNHLQYDALTVGNHDFEPPPANLQKNVKASRFPWLAANLLNEEGAPLFLPYFVLERQGVRIGILGMLTPGTVMWINPAHLAGIAIQDMFVAAQKWVPILKQREQVDLMIGLFHSGHNLRYDQYAALNEGQPLANAAGLIADYQEHFDLILSGHAHQLKPRRRTTLLKNFRTPLLSPGFWGMGVSVIKFFLVESQGRWQVEKTEYDFLAATSMPSAKVKNLVQEDLHQVQQYLQEPTAVWLRALPNKETFYQCGAALSHQALVAFTKNPALSLLPGRWRWHALALEDLHSPLKRLQLFRWLPYDNSLVQAQLFGRQIQILLTPYQRAQQGKYFRSSTYLVPGGFQANLREAGTPSLALNSFELIAQMQPSDAYPVWMTNYHWNGGGMKGEALLHISQKLQESEETLRDLVFSYLQNDTALLPKPCLTFLEKKHASHTP